jgi:hypothetical protein
MNSQHITNLQALLKDAQTAKATPATATPYLPGIIGGIHCALDALASHEATLAKRAEDAAAKLEAESAAAAKAATQS